MRTFAFNKIIRDHILENMLDEGCEVEYEKLSDKKRREKLVEKLIEETKELKTAVSSDEFLEELNDVRLVHEALLASLSSDEEERFEKLHQEKLEAKGGFTEAIWVGKVTVPDDSPWIEYFEKKPEKYPEVTG